VTTDKIQGSITRFFSNPLVGMIGTAASVLGVGLAFLFYFSDPNTPDLTALVHPIRTTLVKSGQASNLSVKFQDKVVDSDITIAQIAVWNRGRLSIRPQSVLKPIEIVIPGSHILEATIRKQSRDVANLRLNTSNLDQGRVLLAWDILERGDGGSIQLIYAGDNTAQINVEGVIEGQPSISRVTYFSTSHTPRPPFMTYSDTTRPPYSKYSPLPALASAAVTAGLIILLYMSYITIYERVKPRAFRITLYTVSAAAALSAICGLFLAAGTFGYVGPPFDF